MEAIFQLLFSCLTQSTDALEPTCREVAERLAAEVTRICDRSQHIQTSGDVEGWTLRLARYRLQQCLLYYYMGSRRGRLELQNILIAIISPYINSSRPPLNDRLQRNLILGFFQGFYSEALNALRQENQLPQTYRPQNRLELAEYMAFTERYAKRPIRLDGDRTQQLIVLRAETFWQQQP